MKLSNLDREKNDINDVKSDLLAYNNQLEPLLEKILECKD